MQQSTYISLNTQAMKLKLSSGTLKTKVEKIGNDCQALLADFNIQENSIQQLEHNESKTSRDFYNLVGTAERNLGDIQRKNEELDKKLIKIEAATAKITELQAKLLGKYDLAISSLKPEEQKNELYDFLDFKAYLNILDSNYTYIVKTIDEVKGMVEKNNHYYDSLQIVLSSFNIDKLKKDTANNIGKVTKNIEALSSIYSNTSDAHQEEISKFLPQLELNIYNLNQKADILFAFGKVKTTNNLSEITKPASNDEQNNSELEHAGLKFG